MERAIYNLMSPICVLPCGIRLDNTKTLMSILFFPADLPDGPDPILPPLQYPQVKTKLFFFNKNNWTFVTDTWNLHQILFYGVLPHFDTLILSQYQVRMVFYLILT